MAFPIDYVISLTTVSVLPCCAMIFGGLEIAFCTVRKHCASLF